MNYYRWNIITNFSCTGADCPDTCCAGWTVYVDKETGDSYQKEAGEFGDKLRASLIPFTENYYKIKLRDNGRCPMLTEENLCEVYQKLGKDRMCFVCKIYPRFNEEVTENCSFAGYYLSCPEVARRFLCQKKQVKMSIYEKGESVPVPKEKQERFEKLMKGLKLSLGILQYRKLSIQERLRLVVFFNDMYETQLKSEENTTQLLETFSDVKHLEKISVSLSNMKKNPMRLTKFLLAVCHNLLYFPSGERLKSISDRVLGSICRHSAREEEFDLQEFMPYIKTKEYEIQFEQYLAYYLYFHYMKALPDYEIMKYVAAAVHMYCIHACFLAILTEEKGNKLDLEEWIVLYTAAARTFEHGEENMKKLRQICEEEGCTETAKLLALLV